MVASKGTWEGMSTLSAMLRGLGPRTTDFLRNQLSDTAYAAFNQSQEEVPVHYGILKASGTITAVGLNPFEIAIGYGGPAAGYALAVHENLTAHHNQGKAKYLEDPVNQALARMAGNMDARVDGVITGQVANDYSGSASQSGSRGGGGGGAGASGRKRKSLPGTLPAEVVRSHALTHQEIAMRAHAMSNDDIHAALQGIARNPRVIPRGHNRLGVYRKEGS